MKREHTGYTQGGSSVVGGGGKRCEQPVRLCECTHDLYPCACCACSAHTLLAFGSSEQVRREVSDMWHRSEICGEAIHDTCASCGVNSGVNTVRQT